MFFTPLPESQETFLKIEPDTDLPGVNLPFIDGLPVKNGDVPWQTVNLPEGQPDIAT